MLWNEWKYSSKKTLNLSHLFFSPLLALLSSCGCSLLLCALRMGFGRTKCLGCVFQPRGTRDRDEITDDGTWGGFHAVSGLGRQRQSQSSHGQQLILRDLCSQMTSHMWKTRALPFMGLSISFWEVQSILAIRGIKPHENLTIKELKICLSFSRAFSSSVRGSSHF